MATRQEYDFHYTPLEGRLPGSTFEQQTEDAINDIGNRVATAEYNSETAIENSETAMQAAQEAKNAADDAETTAENAQASADTANDAVAVINNTLTEIDWTQSFTDENGVLYQKLQGIDLGGVEEETLSETASRAGQTEIANAIRGLSLELLSNNVLPFSNVAKMKETDVLVGSMAVTKGYYLVNDGGAGLYNIRAAVSGETYDNGSLILLDNGNVAELITDGTVNVKQFGAKGDNSTDDKTAFANALKYAKDLYIPCGTYVIGDTITLYNSITIHGDGQGLSIIKADSSFDSTKNLIEFAATITGITFRDITLDGNNTPNTGKSTSLVYNYAETLSDILFENVEIKDAPYHGIVFMNPVTDVLFKNCYFHGNGTQDAGNNHAANIYIYNVSRFKFIDCVFENAWEHGAYLSDSAYVDVINCNFVGNGVRSAVGNGIAYRCSYGVIKGCTIHGSGSDGVAIAGVGGVIQNIIFTNNQIYGNGVVDHNREVGIGGVKNCICDCNIIYELADNPMLIAINVGGTKENVSITNNRIIGYNSGIKVQPNGVDEVKNCQIIANYIEGNGHLSYGIETTGISGDGLIITDNTIKKSTIGIGLPNHVSTNNLFVSNNQFIDCANYNLYDASVGIPHYVVANGFSSASAVPSVGIWKSGDIVWNTAPSAGGVIGWVCTQAGHRANKTWAANTAFSKGDMVYISPRYAYCTTAGTSGGTQPTFSTQGDVVTDGTVQWEVLGTAHGLFKSFGSIES